MHASFNQRNALPKFNNLSTAEWVGICKWTFFLYKNVSVIKKEWLNVNMLKDTEFYEDKIHLLTSVQKEIQDWNFNRSWLRTPRFERLNCFWLLLLYVCAPFVSQLCPGPGCMLAVPGCGARPHPAPSTGLTRGCSAMPSSSAWPGRLPPAHAAPWSVSGVGGPWSPRGSQMNWSDCETAIFLKPSAIWWSFLSVFN